MTDVDDRARTHAALADPTRLGIVDDLVLSDRSPAELAARFGVRSNLLAHHLDVLENAGLIERVVSQGDGRRRYVHLTPGPLVRLGPAPRLQAAGVVFVCTRNSARSQLAAAMWNRLSPLRASSGGTDPAERVHPEAVRAARRRKLDLSKARPALFDPGGAAGRLVVTVCDVAREELGAIRSSSKVPVLHWSIPDPAEAGGPRAFDAAADVLEERVARLVPVVSAA